jgi:CheY-like chemotaxis protein
MKKILFVDDDPVFHFLYVRIIKLIDIDCEVRLALNGKDALDILSSQRLNSFIPDYIFVDLNMPVMDGFCFIERFRAMESSAKTNTMITVLTSSDNDNDRSRVSALGIENYILKPLDKLHLSKILTC